VTYRQANEMANRIANALLAEGLQDGDRVLLFCDNSVEALLTLFGIAKAGLVAAPVNPAMAPDVVKWAIEHVEPRFAIVDAALWPRVESVFAATGLRPGVTIPIGGGVIPGTAEFAEWIESQSPTETEIEIHGDDVWALVFTSGTTAMPKASMTTHNYSYLTAYSYALSFSRGLRYEQDMKLCTFLPVVYHCGHNSVVFPALLTGGTSIVGRRNEADALAAAITRERATALWPGSPPFLRSLVEAVRARPGEYDLHSLTAAMFSWNTLHPDLHRDLKELCGEDFAIWEIMGQTEQMSGTRFWLDQWPEKVVAGAGGTNYVGVPNPMLAAKVVDKDGNSLRGQPGIPGEVVYRSPGIVEGYYRSEEATREAFRDGWFHSGDSCMYDEDGLLLMVDRYKDIVKSGGENVSSLRVEAVVAQHPDVARVAIIGVPDERWGEMVTAFVVPRQGSEPNSEQLIAFCRERLAGFETPKRVVLIDQMPETVGGKILKYKVRELYAAAYSQA